MQADPVTPNAFGQAPNVKGGVEVLIAYENARATESFTQSWQNLNMSAPSGQTMGGYSFSFNASRSNNIFGKTQKVQTRGLQALIIIKN